MAPNDSIGKHQIVIALEQIGFLKSQDTVISQILLHEIKEQAIAFTGEINEYIKRVDYFRRELKDLINNLPSADDHLKSRLRELEDTTGELKTDLASARNAYENLNYKLEQVGKSNVFAFLGIEPGEQVPKEKILLHDFVRDLLHSFKHKLKIKGINYSINISDSETWLVNEESLRRILQNIIDNAVKYSFNRTSLTISADHYRLSLTNYSVYDEHLQGDWPFIYGNRG